MMKLDLVCYFLPVFRRVYQLVEKIIFIHLQKIFEKPVFFASSIIIYVFFFLVSNVKLGRTVRRQAKAGRQASKQDKAKQEERSHAKTENVFFG